MHQPAVHWYEGMFLRPQHFQASDRFWSQSLQQAIAWRRAYVYGLHSIQWSPEALGAYQFQLTSCRIALRDGTLLDVSQSLRLDLRSVFQRESEVTVFLGVPKLMLGRKNAGDSSPSDMRRIAFRRELPDENLAGPDQEIDLIELNARLFLSTENMEGFEVLPIARVRRSGSEEATPEIDKDYFPSVLCVEAWPELQMGILRSIYDFVGGKIEVLSQRVSERGLNLTSQEPGDLDDLLMLQQINQTWAVLHAMTFAVGVHPYEAYCELCRVVGQLSIFDPSRRIDPRLPAYDHDDLARVFRWLQRKIGELLGAAKKLDYEQRFFVGIERGMQVSLDPKWFSSDWQWYIGVHAENINEQACRELLRPGTLNWKMGSAQQVDLLFKHNMPDVKSNEPLEKKPRALPSQRGWLYYEVRREGPAWKDVFATQSLAIRFTDRIIGNLDRLPGQRKLEVLVQDKRAVLEFALFAVPNTNP